MKNTIDLTYESIIMIQQKSRGNETFQGKTYVQTKPHQPLMQIYSRLELQVWVMSWSDAIMNEKTDAIFGRESPLFGANYQICDASKASHKQHAKYSKTTFSGICKHVKGKQL